jgi:Conserved TM helix
MLVAAIRDSVERGFDTFFSWLPALIGALVILIIGYIVAKLVAAAVHRLLQRGGLDRTMTEGQAGTWVSKITSSPSYLIGRVAFWAIFLGAVALAVSALGVEALTSFVGAIFAYLPNVIAALLIFVVATAVAAGIAALVGRVMGDTPTGKVLATVAPGLVMAIAIFMILNQLQIAPEIVIITYAALIGSLALAAALAFGLGGREVAAQMLRGAYEKGQEQREQVRRDVQQGRARAQQDLAQAKERVQDAEGDSVAGPPSRGGERPSVGTTTGAGTMPSTGSMTGAGATSADTVIDDRGPTGGARAERVPDNELGNVPPGSADDVTRRGR